MLNEHWIDVESASKPKLNVDSKLFQRSVPGGKSAWHFNGHVYGLVEDKEMRLDIFDEIHEKIDKLNYSKWLINALVFREKYLNVLTCDFIALANISGCDAYMWTK